MDINYLYERFLQSSGVATDSRSVKGGELFFALRGEHFDGNNFALAALGKGATLAVVSNDSPVARSRDERIFAVDDTLACLQSLALHHRRNLLVQGKPITVIGLTGTNGKTTTKELLRSVLASKYRVWATQGNLNNDIGVPLSLLAIPGGTTHAVIEMGASHPDDIAHLVRVCEPDYGLITNVGKAHLLGFGSFEGVCKAKGQLYDHIATGGKAVFVNSDDALLIDMATRRGLKTIEYGLSKGAKLLPCDSAHPFLRLAVPDGKGNELLLETHLVGSYNATNVLAALSVGVYFGVPLNYALKAVSSYEPADKRSQLCKTERNIVVLDAYNANPSSMAAALDNFRNYTAPRKALLLGQMGELGRYSQKEHISLIMRLLFEPVDKVYLVGEEFRKAKETLKVQGQPGTLHFHCYPNSSDLALALMREPLEGYTILVKGSRSTEMEKVVQSL